MTRHKPAGQKTAALLCIIDGFGFNPNPEGNAVAQSKKPCIDRLLATYPNSTLTTHGERVGLPEGQMGNSEVGHLNIGAGRVVDQSLLKISKALRTSAHLKTQAFQNFLAASKAGSRIHLIGLVSDGGVHSHVEHLQLLIASLLKESNATLCLHIITDGRDTGPNTALEFVEKIEMDYANEKRVVIASLQGRFYAMDRDQRWERVELAYRAIALAAGNNSSSASTYIKSAYEKSITDEFIEPVVITPQAIAAEDALIFWNFRADRMREIVAALCLPGFDHFQRSAPLPDVTRTLCFTDYDATFKLPCLFPTAEIRNYLGAVIAQHGLTQLRVAETEKYPHVTYFLNGGQEEVQVGEDRSMLPSPRDVKTYDLKPEMSAIAVCDTVVKALESRNYDLIVVNFANCDMVGHTGVLSAAIKAVETVDACLARIIAVLEAQGGKAVIIADHGNAEQMINYADGSAFTSHTTFPVPIIVIGAAAGQQLRSGGALSEVAPTLLELMDLPKPAEMTGISLLA